MKPMRLTLVVVALQLLLTGSVAAVEVSLGQATAAPGDVVALRLAIDDAEGIISGGVMISYTAGDVELVDHTITALASELWATFDVSSSPGRIQVGFFGSTAPPSGSGGDLVELRFRVPAGATEDIILEVLAEGFLDADYKDPLPTVRHGLLRLEASDPPGEQELVYGQSLSGRIGSSGDVAEYVFDGNAGDEVLISVVSSDMDTYVELVLDGSIVTFDDDGGDDTNSLISDYPLQITGTYVIRVHEYGDDGTGTFEILLEGDRLSMDLVYGQSVEGHIESPGDVADYTFEGEEGDVVGISVESGDMDPNVELLLNGRTVIADDDGGVGTNSLIADFRLTASGTYVIRVHEYGDDGMGSFLLSLDDGQAPYSVRIISGGEPLTSPAQVRVGRIVTVEVVSESDGGLIEDFELSVPPELGQATGNRLRVGERAGVTETFQVSVLGRRANFAIETVPSTIQGLVVEPQDMSLSAGETVDFDARAIDRFGNVFVPAGYSIGWHVVPASLGEINSRTGVFTASGVGEGYVVAVVSRSLRFGDTGASVSGSGKIVVSGGLPATFALEQNRPNPFNPETEIRFSLPMESGVQLDIYNAAGQLLTTLESGNLPAGEHAYTWLPGDAPSGLYLYRLTTDERSEVRKMLLLR